MLRCQRLGLGEGKEGRLSRTVSLASGRVAAALRMLCWRTARRADPLLPPPLHLRPSLPAGELQLAAVATLAAEGGAGDRAEVQAKLMAAQKVGGALRSSTGCCRHACPGACCTAAPKRIWPACCATALACILYCPPTSFNTSSFTTPPPPSPCPASRSAKRSWPACCATASPCTTPWGGRRSRPACVARLRSCPKPTSGRRCCRQSATCTPERAPR